MRNKTKERIGLEPGAGIPPDKEGQDPGASDLPEVREETNDSGCEEVIDVGTGQELTPEEADALRQSEEDEKLGKPLDSWAWREKE
jgi:hypothetical protein